MSRVYKSPPLERRHNQDWFRLVYEHGNIPMICSEEIAGVFGFKALMPRLICLEIFDKRAKGSRKFTLNNQSVADGLMWILGGCDVMDTDNYEDWGDMFPHLASILTDLFPALSMKNEPTFINIWARVTEVNDEG